MDWTGIKGAVLRDVPMKRYTSMKVGGSVRYMVYPIDEEDLLGVVTRLSENGISYRFLGNGTNVIVNDSGLEEAVIRVIRINILRHRYHGDSCTVTVSGGMSLKRFITDCARRGLSGLEKLYWIPGTVGGGIKMNAGSFGSSISDHLLDVVVFNRDSGFKTIAKDDMSFGYRRSSVRRNDCVFMARFNLHKRDKGAILEDMDYVYRERKTRHPMEFPSSGSVFKSVGGEPAWRFIEKAGLKGMRIGNACVSEKHANFIINLGGATARDIKRLIHRIKGEVFERFGVLLEEEVEFWGFDDKATENQRQV
ncbi:MAG TPA: UDP-N-acetylmuramate dehydrogenase [Syntrophorhabdaceae bacterium]|nr:UDP-N-acetylmuramate dehydrogenase [Syntrophorhabdaceae bacterium]